MRRSAVTPVALALLVTACSAPITSETISTPPSAAASLASDLATDEPSQAGSTSSPSPSSAPELELGPDVVAEVVTTDLVMRSAPGIFEASLIFPYRLGPGDGLYVVDGPVSANGFTWYLAHAYQVGPEGVESSLFGWVAAADRNGEDWVIPVDADCPAEAQIPALHELPMAMRLACFDDRSVELEGDVTCPGLDPPIPTPSPAWLTWGGCYLNPHGAPPYDPFDGATAVGLPIHYPPSAERRSGYLRIVGHFDDPRAAECRFDVPVPEGDQYGQELEHQAQQLRCRASLVVTEANPAGDS